MRFPKMFPKFVKHTNYGKRKFILDVESGKFHTTDTGIKQRAHCLYGMRSSPPTITGVGHCFIGV